MPLPGVMHHTLQRIYDADFAMKDSVADVMEEWDGARLVADGRAPSLWEWNHVALLRSNPENTDALIERIKAFYHKRKRTASVLIDPLAQPSGLRDRLEQSGWSRYPGPKLDTMLWNPASPSISTKPQVYMTMVTNATLDTWLNLITADLPEPIRSETRAMETARFRGAQTWYWFGLYDGVPSGACSFSLRDGVAKVGRISVKPEMQGKGIGLALLNFVTRQSRKDGADITFLYNTARGLATGIAVRAGYSVIAANSPDVMTFAPPE